MPKNLEEVFKNRIRADKPIDLGEFITTALLHPEYGYYTNRDPLGAKGDFTTAPEISQMFGEIIGAWVVDIWMQLGRPAFNLIECGPGRGTLMADIMRIAAPVKGFTQAAHINLIEASPVLREKQQQALKNYHPHWHKTISDITPDKPCIIIGNEFLDALPIEQLKRGGEGWQQRTVTGENTLKFGWRTAEKKLLQHLPNKTLSDEIYEVSPARNGFITECANLLKPAGGAALFIDYGHTKSHHGDTLQAVKNHTYKEVLEGIGQCDITSHIDFEALSRQAKAEGMNVMPIQTQRGFLKTLGIDHRAAALKSAANKETDTVNNIEKALDRLTAKNQMGDLFKILCFYYGTNLNPAGF